MFEIKCKEEKRCERTESLCDRDNKELACSLENQELRFLAIVLQAESFGLQHL